MGVVNDDEFNLEYERLVPSKSNESDIAKVVDISSGRGSNPEVPNSLRKIIGETSVIEGRKEALDLASRFGISPSSVSAYTNGSTSTSSMDESPNKPHLIDAKERVSKRARTKLMLALNSLTPDKINESKGVDISNIAKNMSAIIKNMEPESNDSIKIENKPQFIFYSPQQKTEQSYETIYAKE